MVGFENDTTAQGAAHPQIIKKKYTFVQTNIIYLEVHKKL